MAEFITRYTNNNDEYEVIFKSIEKEPALRVEDFCRQEIDHIKPNEARWRKFDPCVFAPVGFLDEVECSECHKVIGMTADTNAMKYCPYCGRERVDV